MPICALSQGSVLSCLPQLPSSPWLDSAVFLLLLPTLLSMVAIETGLGPWFESPFQALVPFCSWNTEAPPEGLVRRLVGAKLAARTPQEGRGVRG